MTRLSGGLVTLTTIVLSLVALSANTLPIFVDAAPVPRSLSDCGVITLPDGSSYLLAKINDLPSLTSNLSTKAGDVIGTPAIPEKLLTSQVSNESTEQKG
jgi:hypothetical protein